MPIKLSKYHLPYNPKLKETARNLRKNLTPSEKKLWYNFLRDFNLKVHRQKVIGNYIVDFYIAKVKLIIELDGDTHFNPEATNHDKVRTHYFNSLNLEVIRFTNTEVFESFESVCNEITRKVKGKTPPCPQCFQHS